MTTPRPGETADTSLTQDLLYAARYYLGNRRALLLLAAAAITAGAAWNWSWLVAAGIAPILISVLPCAAMCALGLCMNKASGNSCRAADSAKEPAAGEDDTASTTQAPKLGAPHEPVVAELQAGDGVAAPPPRSTKGTTTTDA